MNNPSDAALSFEAVKIAMSQTKDGIKITLVIHPNDSTNDLFSHHVGSRYQVAMVLLDDEGQPVMPKSKTDAERAVTAAAMLCKDRDFQKWMFDVGNTVEQSEDATIAAVHLLCGMKSRAELKTNKEARDKFDELRLAFSQSKPAFL